MDDKEKRILYIVVTLLACLIVLFATFIVPIKSAFLQWISGGGFILSIVLLILEFVNKIKKESQEKEYNNVMQAEYSKTRNPIDAKYYCAEKGKYINSGNYYWAKIEDKNIGTEKIFSVIKKYSKKSGHNNYLLYLRTSSLLGIEKEQVLRNTVERLDGKLVIMKDVSSFTVPDGEYDVNIAIIKVSVEVIKYIFDCFNEREWSFVNICDDYNPDVFSEKDTTLAMNNNYNFKISVSNSGRADLWIRYGRISNIENFVERVLLSIDNK